MEEVLGHVYRSLSKRLTDAPVESEWTRMNHRPGMSHVVDPSPITGGLDDWDYDANEDEYDDAGQGAGVEGDLEMEEE